MGAMITALFGANDALDLLADPKLDRWLFLISFAVFVIIVMWRLMSLHSRLDEYEAKVRLIAKPGMVAWNWPDPGRGKVRLEANIQWEIWTDIDIKTAKICLNMIGLSPKRWWQKWGFHPTEKKLRGLPPKGQDTFEYRKSFRAIDPQPIQDSAEFEYEGPFDADKAGGLGLELVLETGSPLGKYRADVDPRLWERGSRRPL